MFVMFEWKLFLLSVYILFYKIMIVIIEILKNLLCILRKQILWKSIFIIYLTLTDVWCHNKSLDSKICIYVSSKSAQACNIRATARYKSIEVYHSSHVMFE